MSKAIAKQVARIFWELEGKSKDFLRKKQIYYSYIGINYRESVYCSLAAWRGFFIAPLSNAKINDPTVY